MGTIKEYKLRSLVQRSVAQMMAVFFCLGLVAGNSINVYAEEADRFLSNGMVYFSPDGTAFTIGYGDRTAQGYDYGRYGERIVVNGEMELPDLETGMHYYTGLVEGDVPVAYWKLSHVRGQCIHSNSTMGFGTSALDKLGARNYNCFRYYNAGWIPYCAYCGKVTTYVLFYITEQMAHQTAYLPSGTAYSNYFYLCPYDNSLENYSTTNHRCYVSSANRYRIVYNAGNNQATGKMPSEWFYYNNATEYEGEEVNARSRISKCSYSLENGTFLGWGIKPGGEVMFQEEEEWKVIQQELEVSTLENEESVILYAIWNREENNGESDYDEEKDEVLKLKANIVRDLTESDNETRFKQGERGTLNIEAEGFADYVEVVFPKEMDAYSCTFDYTGNRESIKREAVSFSIPMSGIDELTEEFVVMVNAYKDDKIISRYPRIYLIAGECVLDELRTTLR